MIGTDENWAVLHVEVVFWSGKRKIPPSLVSGKYCPHFVVTGTTEYLGVCFLDGTECTFDEPALGNAQPLYPDTIDYAPLENNAEFLIYEGANAVGKGRVLGRTVPYLDFQNRLQKQGFSLPTTDEWAYLCGGGCRTLFPWGDGLDYSMRLHWFEDMDEDENRPYDMEEPNFFGLSIAYDPYMREVVQADRLTTCGGDGGCNICGGLGPFLGFLPCSPHCKPEVQEDNELNGDYDFYRPIIRLEN